MARFVLAIAGLWTACAADPSPIAIDDYGAAYFDASCQYLVTCGQLKSVQECHDLFMPIAARPSNSVLAAIESGKVTYDGASARACVDGIAALRCEIEVGSRGGPLACARVTRGTVPVRGPCALNAECVSQVCELPTCDQACCIGSCYLDQPLFSGDIGAACRNDTECRSELYCHAGSCAPLLPAGASCETPTACALGLTCRSGACTARPRVGEPCDEECADNFAFCSPTTKKCVKFALGGESCGVEFPCSVYYVCTNSRCSLPERIPLGEPCSPSDLCEGPGGFCRLATGQYTGTCIQYEPDGGPCDANRVCATGTCDPSTQTCTPGPICF
jgi:hypothetical protein